MQINLTKMETFCSSPPDVPGRVATSCASLPMTQQQLGDATGFTGVHVNRLLKGLQADGLIKKERRSIKFSHRDQLCEEAGSSERYLHLEQQAA